MLAVGPLILVIFPPRERKTRARGEKWLEKRARGKNAKMTRKREGKIELIMGRGPREMERVRAKLYSKTAISFLSLDEIRVISGKGFQSGAGIVYHHFNEIWRRIIRA